MRLPDCLRSCLNEAASRALPFAVWRRPHADGFEAAIACSPVARRPVFGPDPAPPFFALNRFDAGRAGRGTANDAMGIVADILFRDRVPSFRSGTDYTADPATPLQEILVGARAANRPLQAASGANPPAEAGQSEYKRLVADAVDKIKADRFMKAVTSRAEGRPLDPDYDLLDLTEALAAKLPTAFVALVALPDNGAWLVGTPETLLSADEATLTTIALAGTQWTAVPDTAIDLDSVLWPSKIIEEQALVSRFIRETLAEIGLTDFVERGPRTVRAANLMHLRSDFTIRAGDADPAKRRALLNRLHPTSAVCGLPKDRAFDFLAAREGYDRDCYTGFLGPVNLDGRTDLYVNLRTARILGQTAYLHVGGGIVAGSDPDLEWQETVEKTKVVGSIF